MSQHRFKEGQEVVMVRLRNDEEWGQGEQWIAEQTVLVIHSHSIEEQDLGYNVVEKYNKEGTMQFIYEGEAELYASEIEVIKGESTAF